MSNPIGDVAQLYQPELFSKAAVETFKVSPEKIEAEKHYHYNQIRTEFDDAAILAVLKKWKVPTDLRTTVFGGYIGQFAQALRRIGMKVTFTDASQEWVDSAKAAGLEAFRYPVQELPRTLVDQTDLFATFECYPDLFETDGAQYNKMRLLTSKYGLLFAESSATVKEMNKERRKPQELGTFRRWFRSINNVYGVDRKSKSTANLNFYLISASEQVRPLLLQDLKVMKAIRDGYPSEGNIGRSEIAPISNATGLDPSALEQSLNRLHGLADSIASPYKSSVPYLYEMAKDDLWIGSKRYKILPS